MSPKSWSGSKLQRLILWLDGGWGVDALVGEKTREHNDLDLIVRDADEALMRGVLAARGFAQVEAGVPQSFILADGKGREIDVHPLSSSWQLPRGN
jgi:lincosamide nucleotidyltransferase A/C/D/E